MGDLDANAGQAVDFRSIVPATINSSSSVIRWPHHAQSYFAGEVAEAGKADAVQEQCYFRIGTTTFIHKIDIRIYHIYIDIKRHDHEFQSMFHLPGGGCSQ